VASVLKESKIIDFEEDLSLVKPSDLTYSANFQLVFEGRLKDYQNRDILKESMSLIRYSSMRFSDTTLYQILEQQIIDCEWLDFNQRSKIVEKVMH
jgi:hypothetical protein